MESRQLVALLREIVAANPRTRALGADRVTDLIRAYQPGEVTTLVTALAAGAAEERDLVALEAQLHAIFELTFTGQVRRAHLAHLEQLRTRDLPAELHDYLRDLLDDERFRPEA
ncbi:hypothetical protein [Streptomyces sp. NPDC050145]|uniref:hypothetical protein n=1 Tax=Streptomyces sp. NPDC050145 TaxID=3365602 RepID=UPI00378B509B